MNDASPPSDLTKLDGLQLDQSDNRSRLPSLTIKRAIGGHLSRWIDAILDRFDPGADGWAHALRVWGGIVGALYIGFWLQLESASSAAVTIAILAQPRRGHALSRAVYRVFGTLIGFAASITLVALFGQERELMIAGVSAWLALCIFVSTYLEGGASYGAVLSGYTVGLIAVANLDTPQAAFETGIARTAAIVVGVFVISCINEAFGSPSVILHVSAKLRAAATATQDFARRSLRGESQCPASTIVLLRQIIGVRADIGFVAGEFGDGHARAAGARSAVSALLCEVATARAVADDAKLVDPYEVETLLGAVRCGTGSCDRTSLELEQRLNEAMTDTSTTPERVLLLRRIADLSQYRAWVNDGIEAVAGQYAPSRDPSLPVARDLRDALRSAIRVGILFAVSGVFFIVTGWPAAAGGLSLVATLASLSTQAPSPNRFVNAALISMPLAIVSAGLVRFGLLNTGQGFPLLAIAMAPPIFIACFRSQRVQTASIGNLILIFFPIMLAPRIRNHTIPMALLP